jgi:hypothetical protein
MCVMWNLILVPLERLLASVQDRSTLCAERMIGTGIDLDAPNGTAM